MSKLVYGSTNEEKITSIESVLNSFRRRLSTKVLGMLPPAVVMHHQALPAEDGMLFGGIVPLHSTLMRLCINASGQKAAACRLHCIHGDAETIRMFTVDAKPLVLAVDVAIEAGDLVYVYTNVPSTMTNIMIGMLFLPTVMPGQVQQEQFLLDQFLAVEQKEEQQNASESA